MVTGFNQSVETSHERRVEQVKAECLSESIDFIKVEDITLQEVNAVKAAIGSTLTSFVGGKAEYDFLQVYTLRHNNQMHYFYQPFSGITALPGQHFMVIPVSIKNPIQYRIKKKQTFGESLYQTYINRIPIISAKKIRVCEWLCVDSTEQVKLKSSKLPFLRELSHVWQNGLTKIELDWTFQASAIDQDFTLVNMQTGRYGMISERTGLKQFKQICSFVQQHGKSYAGDGSNNVLLSNSVLSSFFRDTYLSDDQVNNATGVPVWKPQNVVKSVITNILKFEKYKRVYLFKDIDEKKMKNLKACALDKNNIDPSDVIAAAAMDAFGSMKNATVFTKDKIYIADLDFDLMLNLSDVRACLGLKGLTDSSMDLELSDGTVTNIQVSCIGDFMKPFFEELCKIKL